MGVGVVIELGVGRRFIFPNRQEAHLRTNLSEPADLINGEEPR